MNLAEFAAAPSSEKTAFLVRAIRAGLDRLNGELLDAPDGDAGVEQVREVFYGVKALECAYAANMETLIELSGFAFEIEHLADLARQCLYLQTTKIEPLA